MVKQIWLNLPVKNVQESKTFFSKLGFRFNVKQETPSSACMLVGENNFVVMLFEEGLFEGFIQDKLLENYQRSSEVLISIDAQSREEVDEFAAKVREAGGNIFAEPAENQGWMYGCGFADLDGHRWNVLYMDFSEMNK